MLVFGFSSLCMLRQYKEGYHVTVYVYNSLLQIYVPIITIPFIVHKYTLICIASYSSLYREFLLF